MIAQFQTAFDTTENWNYSRTRTRRLGIERTAEEAGRCRRWSLTYLQSASANTSAEQQGYYADYMVKNRSTATARRTTTVTARRGVRRGDVYTVFASSLAATAALADSRNKDARREQWERAIAQVRAQVQAIEEEQQARLDMLSQFNEGEPVKRLQADERDDFRQHITQAVQRSWRQIWPYSHVDSWTNVFKWAAQQDVERAAAGFQDWKGPSLALLQSLSPTELQELLTDERLLHRFYGGPNCAALVDTGSKYPLSAKKRRTLEWSIAKLVLKLLFYSSSSPQPAKNEPDTPVQGPSHIIEHLSPDEPTVQMEARAENKFQVNRTFSRDEITSDGQFDPFDYTLESEPPPFIVQGQSFDDRLAQIDAHIFSLLVGGPESITDANSPYFSDFESPPLPKFRVNTANGFDEAVRLNNILESLLDPSKCKDDISTFISKLGYNLLTSHSPPNVHTYNMLLVRFCHLHNYKMFRAVLTSMRESHIRPNELTHSTVLRYFTSTDRGNSFMEYVLRMEGYLDGLALANSGKEIPSITSQRHLTFFTGEGQKKIAEKARMNGEVYEALIAGALRYFGQQSAIQYYRDMISEGWKASIDLLIAILKSCYRRCDWDAGVSVWHQITALSDQANTKAFEWMLCLCQACGQHVVFEELLRDGVNAGVLPSSMLSLLDSITHRDLGPPCKDAETPESSTNNNLTSGSASVSWVEEHIRNRIAADTTDKKEERPIARVVLSNPIDSAPISWGEGYTRRSMTESKRSDEDPLHAREEWQKTTPVFRPVKTRDPQSRLRMLHCLARKVKTFNEKESQQMNSQEYNDYRYNLPGRFAGNGQLISRNFFEKYKILVVSNLEREDQEGRIYHEPSPFTALHLANYVPNPGSLSSDDECMSCLRSSATTLDFSSHSSSANEPDEIPSESGS